MSSSDPPTPAERPAERRRDGERSLAGRRIGRYEVLCQLAAGGMATVYAARAVGVAGFERLVAIKALHPHLAEEDEFITMFLDEARLAARIRHPNVVPTIDVGGSEADGYFLVMEYVEGHHLGALLQQASKDGGVLPVPVVSRIILDALGGLDAAHALTDEAGRPLHIVHRDVSPHNIMVGVDGVSRLTDFGIARAEVRLSTTRDGQLKGKLGYMSPEQAAGGRADQRSDLFAMGIILWESLTGRRLFRAETNAATLQRVLSGPIVEPSEHRRELAPFDSVIARALARPPHERFSSAAAFAEALEEAGRAIGGVAPTRSVAEAVRTFAREKLERDRSRIQDAIREVSKPGEVTATYPSLPSPSGTPPAGFTQTGHGSRQVLTTGLIAVGAIGLIGALAVIGGTDAPPRPRLTEVGHHPAVSPVPEAPEPTPAPMPIPAEDTAPVVVDAGAPIVDAASAPPDAGRPRPRNVLANPYRP